MATMRAAVFQGKGKIGIREVPRPEPGVGEALVQGHAHDDLRNRRPHPQGRVSGPRGPDRRPRAGRRHRGARPGRDRLRARRSRHRRRHHAVRPVPRLPVGRALAVRPRRRRLRGDRRLAVRQHHQRLPGRVRAGAQRAGQPRQDPGRARPTKRCCSAPTSCRPASRPPSAATCGSATRSPCSRRGRSACARRRARASPGASLVIGVDSVPQRLEFARADGRRRRAQLQGAGRRRGDQAADRAAASTSPSRRSGTQATFENCLRSVRPGRHACRASASTRATCTMPLDAFAAGLGDHTIVTSLCPGGKERMRRLMSIVAAKRFPFRELVTHPFRLADIEAAYDLFSHQRDGVMKVAIRP